MVASLSKVGAMCACPALVTAFFFAKVASFIGNAMWMVADFGQSITVGAPGWHSRTATSQGQYLIGIAFWRFHACVGCSGHH